MRPQPGRMAYLPWGLRTTIQEGRIKPVRLDKTSRTNLIPRAEVDRYRAEHRGRTGRPAKTDKRPAKPAEDE